MSTVVESVATILIGILIVLAFMHLLNGTLGSWVKSKFFTQAN